jgi:hypothetical protein
MFGGVIPHPSRGRENYNWRLCAEQVKKTEWAQVCLTILVYRTRQANWPRRNSVLEPLLLFCG